MTAHQYAMQEAINDLKSYAENSWGDLNKTFELAISALEKQIPKKPIDIERAYNGDYGDCPCCKKSVSDFNNYRICGNCGQALDWSDSK